MLEYDPGKTYSTVKEMIDAASINADRAKNRSRKILESANVSKLVRDEISELSSSEQLTEEQIAKYVIFKRHRAVALDTMMLENAFKENKNKFADDWVGNVLVNAHKTMRDNLIDLAMNC